MSAHAPPIVFALALVAVATSPARAVTPPPASTPFEAADLYRLSMLTDPKVAPGGRAVLWTRVFFDIATDRRRSELWVADIARGGAVTGRRLLVGADTKASGAVWSPRGDRIAFTAEVAGKPVIQTLALAEGVARTIAAPKSAPASLAWSPGGDRIAYVAQVDAKPAPIPGMPAKPEGATWAPDARIIDGFGWRSDAGGIRTPGARQIFTVASAAGVTPNEPVQVTRGDLDQAGESDRIAWTPDGRQIVFSASLRPDRDLRPRDSDLFVVDAVAGGAVRQLTTSDGEEADPQVSPDGRTIAYNGTRDVATFYAQPEIFVVPLAGGPARSLSAKLDRPLQNPVWADNGRAVDALMFDSGVTRVARLSVTGDSRIVAREVGGTRLYLPSSGGGFDSAAGTIAHTALFADRPAGLTIVAGGRATVIDPNEGWRAGKALGAMRRLTWKSSDGGAVEGWALYPHGFRAGTKAPLILDIHGGPNTDYGPMFSITHELYAAAGYIVLFANPRGSIGYGEAFANGIDPKYGGSYPGRDHDDLMAGVDAMVAAGDADPRNLFIAGGSGGGVLTLWAIGKAPDRFRAAAALRPVTDWSMQALVSDLPALTTRYWVPGQPWAAREAYWRTSPLSLVGEVKTPTLLVTGEADYRTPIAQTEAYYQALKLRGVPARMVRLPEAGHNMGRPSQWLQSILAPIDWFDRHRTK